MASFVISLLVLLISFSTQVIQSSTGPSARTGSLNTITSPSADIIALANKSAPLPEGPKSNEAMLSNICKKFKNKNNKTLIAKQ